MSTRFTSTAAGCNQLINLRLCENRKCDNQAMSFEGVNLLGSQPLVTVKEEHNGAHHHHQRQHRHKHKMKKVRILSKRWFRWHPGWMSYLPWILEDSQISNPCRNTNYFNSSFLPMCPSVARETMSLASWEEWRNVIFLSKFMLEKICLENWIEKGFQITHTSSIEPCRPSQNRHKKWWSNCLCF